MRVTVSKHAADRFIERVRPHLDRPAAYVELQRLVQQFGRLVPYPAWAPGVEHDAGHLCVEVCSGIVVIVEPKPDFGPHPVAVTVLTRGGHADGHLGRAQMRRSKQAGRRGKAAAQRKMARGERWRELAPESDEA